MPKLKKSGLKWMHIIHIVLIGIWLGGVVAVSAFATIALFQTDETVFSNNIATVSILLKTIISPVAFITIAQGILYGLFTNWGFFKHKWIAFKWFLMLIVGLLTGIGTRGQINSLISKVKDYGFTGGLTDGGLIITLIALQLIILIYMIIISAYKPKNIINSSKNN